MYILIHICVYSYTYIYIYMQFVGMCCCSVHNLWQARSRTRSFTCTHAYAHTTEYVAHSALATHCTTLQHTATHCHALQHTATHCNTLHHTATHCTTLQHTATLTWIFSTLGACNFTSGSNFRSSACTTAVSNLDNFCMYYKTIPKKNSLKSAL